MTDQSPKPHEQQPSQQNASLSVKKRKGDDFNEKEKRLAEKLRANILKRKMAQKKRHKT